VFCFYAMRKYVTGLVVSGASLSAMAADAPTDITGVTSAVSGYATAAIAIGITVMLFVIGRRVVRKLF
jgi:hypothetical protein